MLKKNPFENKHVVAQGGNEELLGRVFYDEEPGIIESQESGLPRKDKATVDPTKNTIRTRRSFGDGVSRKGDKAANDFFAKNGFDKFGNPISK